MREKLYQLSMMLADFACCVISMLTLYQISYFAGDAALGMSAVYGGGIGLALQWILCAALAAGAVLIYRTGERRKIYNLVVLALQAVFLAITLYLFVRIVMFSVGNRVSLSTVFNGTLFLVLSIVEILLLFAVLLLMLRQVKHSFGKGE